jgi:hypothetical protein
MDWQEHLSRTRRSGRKAEIAMALEAAQDAFEEDTEHGKALPAGFLSDQSSKRLSVSDAP